MPGARDDDSDQRFRAFVRATSDVVYRMSPDWSEMRFLDGRSFIADTTDPSRTWMEKYIAPIDQPAVTAAIERAIATKTMFELEHRVIRTDGSLGWTFSRAVPVIDDATGDIVEWIGAATDVTARREAQEALVLLAARLEDADRQKNEFLAMLAHELRNPLAPIRNAAELLARTVNPDPQVGRALATVERQVVHLTRLVDDLLDISRITQNRIDLQRTSVALDRIVGQAIEQVEPIVRQGRHRLVFDAPPAPIVVDGDAARLVQCVGNLLANAAKYSPPESEIQVALAEAGGQAVIRVSDNGLGIAPDLLPNLFGLFVQGERTIDRSQGGLGIGLTIVKRLVEMHGGTVTAASDGIGRGATFEIRLPAVVPPSPRPSAAAPAKVRPRKILVVDDNEDAAIMLADLLRSEGHQVDTSFSGPEAIEVAGATRPDVVLLDLGLPGMDGFQVARHLRDEVGPEPPRLVAITGYGQQDDRERSQAAGFAAHLVKPISFETLRRVLADLN